jgi:hypothetical protein
MFDNASAAGRAIVQQQGYEMIEYVPPADEQLKLAQIAGKPLWDAWLKEMANQGHPESRDILNTCLNLIETYQP